MAQRTDRTFRWMTVLAVLTACASGDQPTLDADPTDDGDGDGDGTAELDASLSPAQGAKDGQRHQSSLAVP